MGGQKGKSNGRGFTRTLLTAAAFFVTTATACNLTVANTADAYSLITLLTSCESKDVHVSWEGHVVVNATISVPEGVSLTVLGGETATADGGGAVQLFKSKGALHLDNLILTGGAASGSGGAVSVSKGDASFSNCSFTSNTAGGDGDYDGGGAVFVYGGTMTMTLCTFSDNSARSRGGAVYIRSGGSATMSTCTFTSNFAVYGGGVEVDGEATMESCSFANNNATYGGGVFISDGTVAVNGGNFTSNMAVIGGGVSISDGTVAVNGSSFDSNTAGIDGGGVYISEGTIAVSGSSFDSNTATYGGGGVFISDGTVGVNGSSFDSNTAGSGVGVNSYRAAAAGPCNPYGGGGVYISDGTVAVNGSSFTSNTAGSGGGVYISDGTVAANSSSFANNTAGDGGGVYISDGTVAVNGSSFANNTAGDGGGVYISDGTVAVNGSSFANNTAGSGGAVYVTVSAELTTWSSDSFMGNKAQLSGGAIFSEANVVLQDCLFAGNVAASDGGAVQLREDTKASYVPWVRAVRSTFTSNSAANGGALAAPNVTVSNVCIFSHNAATNGGAVYSTEQVVDDGSSTFENNRASTAGAAIFMEGVDWTSEYFSAFENNDAACCYSPSYKDSYSCVDVNGKRTRESACCGAGTWYGRAGECVTCPNGFDCSQPGSLPQVLPGYWIAESFYSTTPPTTRQCWFKDACEGGDPLNFDLSCDDRYLDGSPYCAVCDHGYSRGLGYECVKCSAASKAGMATALAIVAIVVAAVVWYIVSDLSGLRDAQGAAVSAQYPAVAVMTAAKAAMTGVTFSKIRVPIVVFQIVSQFVAITGVRFPQVYEQFLAFTSIFTFDMGRLLSLGCVLQLTFYQRLLVATITPLAVVGLLGCSFAFMRWRVRPRSSIGVSAANLLERVHSKHALLCLVFTFLVYSTTSTVVFQTFACERIPETDDWWLRADYSVSCKLDRTRIAYLVYSSVMALVYPIGIPAVYAWLLWRQRAALVCGQLNRSTKTTYFLWQPYKPSRYWWELAECVRRLCLTGILVFILPGTSGQLAVACVLAVLSMVAIACFSPLADWVDFLTYILGCMIIFLTTFLALVIKVDVANENAQSQVVLVALLIALNVLLVAAAIAQCLIIARHAVGEMRASLAYGLVFGRAQMAPES